MHKVTTINLDGRAYQLEEAAYTHLQQYLTQARAVLASDPDKDEILSDLEQAIAEKCDQVLKHDKNVVATNEIETILEAMGPVELPQSEEPIAKKKTKPTEGQPPRRLYLLRDNAVLGGVCSGLAAYFNIDVTVVRVIFVALTFITSGAWILAYFLLLIIVPEAETPEEKAAAHGQQFSAQELVNKAKHKYADLKSDEHWSRVAQEAAPAFSRVGEVIMHIIRIASGFAAAIVGILTGILAVAWLWVIGSIVFGHLHLYDQLSTIGMWVLLLGATAVFFIGFLPMTLAATLLRRLAAHRKITKKEVWWSVMSLFVWVVAIFTAGTIVLVNFHKARDFQQTHGYLRLNDSNICINEVRCN